jgi:hypothetical protein
MQDRDIDAFFQWFSSNAAALMRASENPEVVAKLNEWVDVLNPNFAWEIGPGSIAEWSFSLSPDGDETLSAAVRYVIARAPQVPEWEFHAFRQPRDALPIVDLTTMEGTVQIDATDAEYALLRAKDGTFDMVVMLPAAKRLRPGDQGALAVLLLDGLIGEEARMSLIKNVEFVQEFEPRYRGRTTNIKHLKNHLNQLMRRERGTRSEQ